VRERHRELEREREQRQIRPPPRSRSEEAHRCQLRAYRAGRTIPPSSARKVTL
jgi:hypothetical protein